MSITPLIRIKRVYESALPADGARILVDRVWPRGISKERAGLALWAKEAAPSTELRKWFGHAPERWDEFRARYQAELHGAPLDDVRELLRGGPVTLVYSAHDEQHNQAVVLAEFLSTSPA